MKALLLAAAMIDEGVPCCGAPQSFRVLAALAGIPEENAPMDDDVEEGDAA
jgi:hypothetical protein